MEQVLHERKVPEGYEDIVLYDDDGNRVTNLETLQSIREGQRIIAEWEARREHKTSPKIDWRTIRIYEEDGTQITDPDTLHGIAEAQEIIAEWEARTERWEREGLFDGWEEDEDFDESEKVVGK